MQEMRPSYKSIMKAHTHTHRDREGERDTHTTCPTYITQQLRSLTFVCCASAAAAASAAAPLSPHSLSLSSLSACTMAAMLLSKTKVVHAALACVERGTEREATATCDASRCVVCFVGSTQTQRVLSNRDTHTHTHVHT